MSELLVHLWEGPYRPVAILALVALVLTQICKCRKDQVPREEPKRRGMWIILHGVFEGILAAVLMILVAGLLTRVEAAERGTGFSYTDNLPDSFREMRQAVESAQSEIRTMHLRRDPPSATDAESKAYQDAVERWAQQHCDTERGGKVFRIVNPKMRGISGATGSMIAAAKAHPANYLLAAVPWETEAPFPNLVIVDERVAFICIYSPGHSQMERSSMQVIRIERPDVVAALVQYHRLLCENNYISGQDFERATAIMPTSLR